MILVITGFHGVPFDRLVRIMDDIASRLQEEVVIQKGSSKLETVNARSFAWLEESGIDRLYERARIVVAHAGVGTILDCVRHKKPIVLVPRRESLGELFDDHQLELVEALSRDSIITSTEDTLELEKILGNRDAFPISLERAGKGRLVDALKQTLEEIRETGAV